MGTYLYYGNGECTVESDDFIVGVEIDYRGSISAQCTAKNYQFLIHNNKILIFPNALNAARLNNLFTYHGEFKILQVNLVNSNHQEINAIIKPILDYSDMLGESETLTKVSEKLNSTFSFQNKKPKNLNPENILANQHTDKNSLELYLNKRPYNGSYHVHLLKGTIMTGSTHSKDSQILHYRDKKANKIIKKIKGIK